jgi:hypothetical protein
VTVLTLFYPSCSSHRPGITAVPPCSWCQIDVLAHTCPSYLQQRQEVMCLGVHLGRNLTKQILWIAHFPRARLMAHLPTVSPSVVAANDFSPQRVSSEQQGCFNSHLVLMMPFKCIKRISKYQTGGPSTGDNSYWHWHAMQGQNSYSMQGMWLGLTVGNFFSILENSPLFPVAPQTYPLALFTVASTCISELTSICYFSFHLQEFRPYANLHYFYPIFFLKKIHFCIFK